MDFSAILLSSGNGASTMDWKGLAVSALPIVAMVAAMFFLVIRPQKKKEKAEKLMRENLQIGDEILTIGGIYGRVISLKEDTIVIESKSDHSKLTIARWAMQQNLTVHDDVAKK